ncbi:succinate dehydrogenase, cytochrome b556 subunit [Asticcacaulis sp. EMRT-3]|uniref:succinate dehydrogenase, cytochrome b556 subunit n=1 Tax=Asticcacaulis sp. EMRT-3 TaxID=3040349 RepID=UPI0024AF2F06|nr:succinate dehydrogenase, cytochrome b556 subunit [Asticcacaulis sp. EMRT-3]MDI7775902.1 succinate dehydrogenase, cytochrome b556 subunit [Asticcacaulis sp. EMRT-3]
MSQTASNKTAADKTASGTPSPTPRRPLSPHLQVWRWHITMFTSILHRVTGFGSVAGLVMIAAWLVCLALGPQAYTGFMLFGKSPLGLLIWFLLSLAGFLHMTGGIRHWVWDMGAGFKLPQADALALWFMILGVVLTLAFWACLLFSGKVIL